MEKQTSVKSAQRVLELLEYFADVRRPASIKEICQSLGYPQSSTSVLMKSLVDLGYFDYEQRTRMYVPNLRLALSTSWIQEEMYSTQSLLRLMGDVQQRTGHAVMIGAQDGVFVRYLHVLQANDRSRFALKSGALRPLFRSAAGKMLLTTKTDREIELLLHRANVVEQDVLLRLDLATAREEIVRVRLDGYSMSRGTATPGGAALAVLLPVRRGAPQMTLSIGGPIAEIRRDKAFLLSTLTQLVSPFRQAVVA
ncbi:IclR family transcriptional regulator [Burkholderia aenigmatica]|uniref:Transcriptional regulator, IclR family protein n=1 Tax=Burkholderia aenigmatica TaxID=2015348 RepID=A0A228J390_9BURK|nr:helix-turn-helix domain-containing protein [Burkholderia aenigmatica]OXI49080.1 transcriptional regulator, IclR family protein [Burkholderia aenigmatica]